MIRRKRRIRIALRDVWDAIKDLFTSHTNDWDSEEAIAGGRAYGAFKRRMNAGARFKDNPKALRAWERLTHNGRRFDDVCHYCGARTTDEEREELDALFAAFPWRRKEGSAKS